MREAIDGATLTSYALGELSEAERAAVAARLAESEELRDELREIEKTAALLRQAFTVAPQHALSVEQRSAVEAEALRLRPVRTPVRRTWQPVGLAAAAALILALSAWWLVPGGPWDPTRPPSTAVPTVLPAPATHAPAEPMTRPAAVPTVPPRTVVADAATPPPNASPAGDERDQVKSVIAPADGVAVVDVALQPGSVEEMAVVEAAPRGAKLVGAETSGTITGEAVRELTLNGRSFAQLMRLEPGVAAVEQSEETRVQEGAPSQATAPGKKAPAAPLPDSLRASSAEFTTEAYDSLRDNPFVRVSDDPRSTFSVDVDTASYSNVRRFLNESRLPPKDAVRIEELVNYFDYDYAPPTGKHPFAVHMEAARCPWQPQHRLVRIALKGRELKGERPPANIVFLVDVSGSMGDPNKLPLVKEALKLLVDQLGERDRIAIVVYAGAEGLALPSTPGSDKATIRAALDSFRSGGTTHGSAGLRLAYETAAAGFIEGGVNRIVLATDGDFNVGITNQGDLVRLIEEKAKGGVFLTALGFGMGNYKDSTLEKFADHGNGNYAYIDTLREARKVLVDQLSGTLVTIAKDVKLQLEFNPATVQAFRLIGYENRVLAHQDFNDDEKDAGEIGAGHTVTALYEVVPPGVRIDVPGTDALKYQQPSRPSGHSKGRELLTLKLRYKQPDADRSQLLSVTLDESSRGFESASADFRFAAAVASFGMVLRDSPHKGTAELGRTLAWAGASLGADEQGWRSEFLELVARARALARNR